MSTDRPDEASRASLWVASTAPPSYERLAGDLEVDVAIIGGGIVGVTAAQLLQRAGRRVAVLEALRVGAQATGGSTAKVTSQHALIYRSLVDTFGATTARRYGEANEWALRDILERIEAMGVHCSLERFPAYTFSIDEGRRDDLEQEAEVAARLGLPARYVTEVPLPFATAGAVVFDGQAQFDPVPYVHALANSARADGARIFEDARVTDLEERGERSVLTTEHGTVTARDVIVATALPCFDDGSYYRHAQPGAHLVIAARVEGDRPDGMFISIDDPTRSLRWVERDGVTWMLLVGPRFAPGDHDTTEGFADLDRFAREHFDVRSIDYRWWNEDYYPVDLLPYVGRMNKDTAHTYVATGFGGWGITNGHIAAHILADAILGQPNEWAAVFDSTRESKETDSSPLASAGRMISAGVSTVRYAAARLVPVSAGDVEALQPGEADVIDLDGERVAVARDREGALHAVSALCSHMGCELGWNESMETWDCPCHGSCFDIDGGVLRGPAVQPLESKQSAIDQRARP